MRFSSRRAKASAFLTSGIEHGELVADESGNPPRKRTRALAASRKLLEQVIARLAAKDIVDVVEALDVEQDDRKLTVRRRRVLDVLGQALMEQVAVWQTRQRVIKGEIIEPRLRGHVLQRKSDIAGQLPQQLHFLLVKKASLARI